MKNKLPTIITCLFITLSYGFDVGQEIELDSFLNGRSSAEFLKSKKNIVTTLSKGTTGKVEQIANFSSGNSGIKMKITKGPRAGESYWVYYNKNKPALKLVDKATAKPVEPETIVTTAIAGPPTEGNPTLTQPAGDTTATALQAVNGTVATTDGAATIIDPANAVGTILDTSTKTGCDLEPKVEPDALLKPLIEVAPIVETTVLENDAPANAPVLTDDQTPAISENISINNTTEDQKNCPSPAEITALKMHITKFVLSTASLTCSKEFNSDPALRSYVEKNLDKFKTKTGVPVQESGYSASFYALMSNKIYGDGYQDTADKYYVNIFGKKDHSFDNIGSELAMTGFDQAAPRNTYCIQFVRDMDKIMNAPDKASFEKATNNTAYANDPKLWNSLFDDMRTRGGGIGKCSIPNTAE